MLNFVHDVQGIKLEGIAEEVKEHKVVNHGKREWARGEAYVNGSENRNGFLRTYLSRY